MDSSNAEKAARAAYIAFHEGLSGFDAARAWDDMTPPADDWSQEAIDWTHAVKAALSSRDAEVAELRERLAAAEAVIEKAKTILQVTLDDNPAAKKSFQALGESPSVILEDRDRENRAAGWDEGERHESEYLSEWGQFCPGEHCNPHRGEKQ